jgi:hypothetical protein
MGLMVLFTITTGALVVLSLVMIFIDLKAKFGRLDGDTESQISVVVQSEPRPLQDADAETTAVSCSMQRSRRVVPLCMGAVGQLRQQQKTSSSTTASY